jgi:hypothetical protein
MDKPSVVLSNPRAHSSDEKKPLVRTSGLNSMKKP